MADGTLCPSCGELIPAGASGCSRCGYETRTGTSLPAQTHHSPVASAANPYAVPYPAAVTQPTAYVPDWQETAFKVMAIVILVDGILELVCGLILIIGSKGGAGGSLIGHGSLMTAIGAGLLLEYPFASTAVKITCWVNLFLAAGLLLGGMGLMLSGQALIGLAVLGGTAVFGGLYGFMLYLVNRVGLD